MSYTIVIEGTYSRPLAGPLGWLEFKDFLDSVNDDDFVHTKELVNYGANQALPQLRRELEELLQRNPDSAVASTIEEFIAALDASPLGAMRTEITRVAADDNGQNAETPAVATQADLEQMMPTETASPAAAPAGGQPSSEPDDMSEGITLAHPEIPPVVHVEPRPAKPQPAAPAAKPPVAKPMKKAAKAAPTKPAPAKKAAAPSAPAKKAAAKKTVKKAAKKPVKKALVKKALAKKAAVKKTAKKVAKKVTAVKKATPAKKAAPKKAAKKMPPKPMKKKVVKKASPKKSVSKKAPPKKVKAVKKAVKKPAKKTAKKKR